MGAQSHCRSERGENATKMHEVKRKKLHDTKSHVADLRCIRLNFGANKGHLKPSCDQ